MGLTSVNRAEIRRVARQGLGFRRLRPGQQQVIESVIDGRDTLAVMPTGSGKSAIYQIAGALLPGATVIVSPLLALQADQMRALEDGDVGEAAAVNSAITEADRAEALHDVSAENLEFIFLAPEQFSNAEVMDRLQDTRVSLFVVDEAHCVSEWGHDFRPDYLKLGGVIEALGRPTVLALTATASPPVRKEIVSRLGMREVNTLVRGFDRPNIWLGVDSFTDDVGKERALIEHLALAPKPGIVYVSTRKRADEFAARVRNAEIHAKAYHAGMTAKERERVHGAFVADDLDVIIATIAFGMGVDKPNVRFVFHHDISESVDAYYQEVGRGGRDGEPAEARLFYAPGDVALRRFFASSGELAPEQMQQVVDVLHGARQPLTPAQLGEQVDLSRNKLAAALNRLTDLGAVEAGDGGGLRLVAERLGELGTAVHDAVEAQEHRRQYERSRVEMMRGYAEHTGCRRQYILSYFGEDMPDPCGNCDNCAHLSATGADESRPFPVGGQVKHAHWGVGQVLRYDGDMVVVLFDSVGYKTLAVPVVIENQLLQSL
jgi:ATP-dependent DNA helicase RecQ